VQVTNKVVIMFFKKEHAEYATLPLRLGLGTVFLMHGMQKMFGAFSGPGISGVQGFMASLNVPLPNLFGILVSSIEFFGGLFVILGLFTRYAASLIAIVMFFAYYLVHAKGGFFLPMGFEFVFTLFLMAVALMLSGSGKFSLDRALFKKDI